MEIIDYLYCRFRNDWKIKSLLIIGGFITLMLFVQGASPELHAIEGYVFESDGVTQVGVGTVVMINTTFTGDFIEIATNGPPGHTGFFAGTINGNDAEWINVTSFNSTSYGREWIQLVSSPGVSLINVSLIFTRPSEMDVDIDFPSNSTEFFFGDRFHTNVTTLTLGGQSGNDCAVTLALSNYTIANLSVGDNYSKNLGNLAIGAINETIWSLEALSVGFVNITVFSSCTSDGENFNGLNNETVFNVEIKPVPLSPPKLHAVEGYVLNLDGSQVDVGTIVTVNATVSGDFLSLETNGPPGHTGFYGTAKLNASDGELIVITAENATYRGTNTTILMDDPGVTLLNVTLDVKRPLADLTLSNLDIHFIYNTLIENSPIQINVTILNEGDRDIEDVIVQFYNGDPNSGGLQIGNDESIDLEGFTNSTISVSYNIALSLNNIFVILDPPLISNGFIIESNETNNKANNSFHVPSYQTIFGNITSNITTIRDNAVYSLFNWTSLLHPKGLIFATDSDSNVNFASLEAIGRDIFGEISNNDFYEMDALLSSSSYNDSLSLVYTSDGNTPDLTKIINLMGKNISNVPVVNSSHNTDFITGILWDSSDDDDGEFDSSDSEDLVFLSQIIQNGIGSYGVYDYELSFPVRLRNYKGPDFQSVDIYYELGG